MPGNIEREPGADEREPDEEDHHDEGADYRSRQTGDGDNHSMDRPAREEGKSFEPQDGGVRGGQYGGQYGTGQYGVNSQKGMSDRARRWGKSDDDTDTHEETDPSK